MKNKLAIIVSFLVLCLVTGCLKSSNPKVHRQEATNGKQILKSEPKSKADSRTRRQAEALFNKAMAYYRHGRYPEARRYLKKTLSLDPHHGMASRMLVPQLGRKPLPFAIHVVKAGDTLNGLCQKYYGTTDGCEVLTSFNNLEHPDRLKPGQVLVLPPQTTSRWPQDYRRSLPRIIASANHQIKNGQSLSRLARMYYGNLPLFHAIASFNKLVDATRVSDGSIIKIPRFAKIPFRNIHQKTKGKNHLRGDGRKLEKQRQRALHYFRKKRWQEAISAFRAVLAIYPHDEVSLEYLPKALFQQAKRDFQLGRFLKAKKGFEATLAYDINCKECGSYIDASIEEYKKVHYQRGIEFFNRERLEEAIAEWEKVYALDPDYKAVEYNLNHARRKLPRPSKPGQVAPDSP